MNPLLGWALALAFVVLAWLQYGWQGVLFASGAVVFWLLLQLNRALRAMRRAGQRPVGQVPSAVMLHARLRRGMTMLELVTLTKSLGRRVGETPEAWEWRDAGGAAVRITFAAGKVDDWALSREPAPGQPPPPQAQP